MASIFLSYGRADDEPFVNRLYQHLSENGFSVWYDRVSMPSRAGSDDGYRTRSASRSRIAGSDYRTRARCFMHGMGGTGKSVLAAAFARSTTTRRSFADGIVWLGASPETEPLDLLRRCGQLISGAPQSRCSTCSTFQMLSQHVAASGKPLVALRAHRLS